MKSMNKSQIKTYLNILLPQSIPKDHFLIINKEERKIELDIKSSSEQTYSFCNVFFDKSIEDALSQYITSSLTNDLYQGYDNAIVLLSDDNSNKYDLIRHIAHLTQQNLLEHKSSIEGSYLNDISCASFMICNNQCFDLLSNSYINITEFSNSKETLIEGLSYQKIMDINEGNDFMNVILFNYNTQRTSSSYSSKVLCVRILALFKSENGDDIVNTYISKLDILFIPLIAKCFLKDTPENNYEEYEMQSLLSILYSIQDQNTMSQYLRLLLKEYLFGNTKTAMITSINKIMSITKEEAEELLKMIKTIESIETNPISKQDTISNLIYIKSLYNQSLTIKNKLTLMKVQSSSQGQKQNELIFQIKELLNHQYSMTNTLRRLPFISFDILSNINKYKEDCDLYYNVNYKEINELKETLLSLITQLELFKSNNLNGQEAINTITAKINEAIELLKKPIPSLNSEVVSHLKTIESEAYWNLLEFYSMKDLNSALDIKGDDDEGRNLKELMYRSIELNEKIYQAFLKGKICDSYEVIDKEEYIDLIKQLNESKYNTEQNIEINHIEVGNYQSKIDKLNNEIEKLNERISFLQLKSLKKKQNDPLVISNQKEFTIESKKKLQYKSRSVSKIQKKQPQKIIINTINRPMTVLSFTLISSSSSNKTVFKKSQSPARIKVTKKQITDFTRNSTSKRVFKSNTKTNIGNYCSVKISKCISFSYINIKPIDKNFRSSSISKQNNHLKILKDIKQNNTNSYISNKCNTNENEELLNKIKDQNKEIDYLKGLNESILKQKELDIYSYSLQLKQTKERISFLEEDIQKSGLSLEKITKDKESLQYQLKQSQSSTSVVFSPIGNIKKLVKESYSAKKQPHLFMTSKYQSSPISANKSLDMNEPYRCKRARLRRELNENSQLTHGSLIKMDKKKKLSLSKYTCNNSVLNESTMRMINEIKDDNNMLLKEINHLQVKNIELSNNITLLQRKDTRKNCESLSKINHMTYSNV